MPDMRMATNDDGSTGDGNTAFSDRLREIGGVEIDEAAAQLGVDPALLIAAGYREIAAQEANYDIDEAAGEVVAEWIEAAENGEKPALTTNAVRSRWGTGLASDVKKRLRRQEAANRSGDTGSGSGSRSPGRVSGESAADYGTGTASDVRARQRQEEGR